LLFQRLFESSLPARRPSKSKPQPSRESSTLDSKYPGFRASVCDESGSLRRFINIYLDGEDVRFLENLATPVTDGAEIAIVPAISGG